MASSESRRSRDPEERKIEIGQEDETETETCSTVDVEAPPPSPRSPQSEEMHREIKEELARLSLAVREGSVRGHLAAREASVRAKSCPDRASCPGSDHVVAHMELTRARGKDDSTSNGPLPPQLCGVPPQSYPSDESCVTNRSSLSLPGAYSVRSYPLRPAYGRVDANPEETAEERTRVQLEAELAPDVEALEAENEALKTKLENITKHGMNSQEFDFNKCSEIIVAEPLEGEKEFEKKEQKLNIDMAPLSAQQLGLLLLLVIVLAVALSIVFTRNENGGDTPSSDTPSSFYSIHNTSALSQQP